MDTLIIYGSEYGTSKQYAEKFSEMTNVPVISYEMVKDLSQYDRIVYFGGLYAGGVKGLKHMIRRFPKGAKLIAATVGLADVQDEENVRNIRKALSRQIPEDILKDAAIFHLRGGIDYQKLSFKHRTMMTLLYNKVKKLPEEKKTAEIRAMIETFQSKVDFVDYHSLNQIAEMM